MGSLGPSGLCGPGLPAQRAVAAHRRRCPDALDKAAAKWVEDTFKKMTLDDKVGQLVVSSVNSTYLATDTDEFDTLAKKVVDLRLGGIHVFGGAEPAPAVLTATTTGR